MQSFYYLVPFTITFYCIYKFFPKYDNFDETELNIVENKKKDYKKLLKEKNDELDNLILQLETVNNNINLIRERVDNLNIKSIT